MIADSIAMLKKAGREVFFDLEHFFDGYKDDPGYALAVLQAGHARPGPTAWCSCDTNGGTLPSRGQRASCGALPRGGARRRSACTSTTTRRTRWPTPWPRWKRGAVHVQGTINGWGERCGNANLCVLVPNLCLKMGRALLRGQPRAPHLPGPLRGREGEHHPRQAPALRGRGGLLHKAGQHADVVAKAPTLMEHIHGDAGGQRAAADPLGAGRQVHGGASAWTSTAASTSPRRWSHELTGRLKDLEEYGYEYEAAEASFDLIIRRALERYRPLLELRNYHLESYKAADSPAKTVGRIFLPPTGARS